MPWLDLLRRVKERRVRTRLCARVVTLRNRIRPSEMLFRRVPQAKCLTATPKSMCDHALLSAALQRKTMTDLRVISPEDASTLLERSAAEGKSRARLDALSPHNKLVLPQAKSVREVGPSRLAAVGSSASSYGRKTSGLPYERGALSQRLRALRLRERPRARGNVFHR